MTILAYTGETEDGDSVDVGRCNNLGADDFAIIVSVRMDGCDDSVSQLIVTREQAVHIAAGLVTMLAVRP